MNRIFFGLLLLFFFFSSPAWSDPSLRVGITLPLTGLGAPYGEAFRNGLFLRLKGHETEVEIALEDHQYDGKSALAAVRKFASVDNKDLIFVWGYGPSDTVAPIVATVSSPVILASLNPISKKGGAILNFSGPLEDVVEPLREYILRKPYGDISLIAASIGSLEQSANALRQRLPNDNKTPVETVNPDLSDFQSLITRLKSAQIRSVGLFLTPPQITTFIKQARNQRFTPRFFGVDTFNDAGIRELFSAESDGPVFTDAYLDSRFKEEYEARFGSSSHIVEAARGRLLGDLLLHIRATAKQPFRREGISQAIDLFKPGIGPAGKYQIEHSLDFGRYLSTKQVLYRIVKGKTESIE